jgi:hypothetical protein
LKLEWWVLLERHIQDSKVAVGVWANFAEDATTLLEYRQDVQKDQSSALGSGTRRCHGQYSALHQHYKEEKNQQLLQQQQCQHDLLWLPHRDVEGLSSRALVAS